jgi:hypothetical protein
MSVLTLDTPVINYIRAAIEQASYSTVVDSGHYPSIIRHMKDNGSNGYRDIEAESLRLVRSWSGLNDKSYAGRYREPYTDNMEEIQAQSPFKPIKPVQLLKYVQCLIYNIEPEHFTMTEQEAADYKLLKRLERDISQAIISQMPEYIKAEWC